MGIGKRGKEKLSSILVLAAFIAGFPILMVVVMSSVFPDVSGQPHQSDEELIANFNSHKAEFEKLLAMVLEDKMLSRVDENYTEPSDAQAVGISQERIAEYRRLFRELGIARGFSAPDSRDYVEFISSSQGWVDSGSSKGYLYGTGQTQMALIDSLDKFSSQPRPRGSGRRRIEGKWSLYFYGN